MKLNIAKFLRSVFTFRSSPRVPAQLLWTSVQRGHLEAAIDVLQHYGAPPHGDEVQVLLIQDRIVPCDLSMYSLRPDQVAAAAWSEIEGRVLVDPVVLMRTPPRCVAVTLMHENVHRRTPGWDTDREHSIAWALQQQLQTAWVAVNGQPWNTVRPGEESWSDYIHTLN